MPNITGSRILIWSIVLAVVLVAVPGKATAGEVLLVSETHDWVCKVIVVWGNNAPEKPLGSRSYSEVKKGDKVHTANPRLCYKRSSNPNDCASDMTREWRCSTNLGTPPQKFDLR